MLLQPHRDRAGDFLVIERQDAVQRLDEGHLGAQLAIGDAEFQADIARPDDDQLFRTFGQIQRLGRPDHRFAEGHEGQFHFHRTGGQDHILGRDLDLFAVFLRDDAGLGVGEFGPAGDVFGTSGLDQLRHAAGQLGDDTVLPAHQLAHVQLGRLGERNAETVALGGRGHVLELGRRMDHRLGGDAAAIEAGPAQTVLVYNDRVEAQLAGADRSRIAARATTDDEDLASALLHGVRSLAHEQGGRVLQEPFDPLDQHGGVIAVDDTVVETG